MRVFDPAPSACLTGNTQINSQRVLISFKGEENGGS
jgi:hypothetical protein